MCFSNSKQTNALCILNYKSYILCFTMYTSGFYSRKNYNPHSQPKRRRKATKSKKKGYSQAKSILIPISNSAELKAVYNDMQELAHSIIKPTSILFFTIRS